MKLLVIGRSPFPEEALKHATPYDEGDHAVVARSHALGDRFHGLVEVRLNDSRLRSFLRVLEAAGWKEYRPEEVDE